MYVRHRKAEGGPTTPAYNLDNAYVKELRMHGIITPALLLAFIAAIPLLADDISDELLAQSRKGDVVAVNALLDKGADVNARSPYGQTPLFFASDRGHTEVVKLLLE